MKKNIKKITALILVVLLILLSVIPVAAAEESRERRKERRNKPDTTIEEEIYDIEVPDDEYEIDNEDAAQKERTQTNEPTEYEPIGNIEIHEDGNYIISKGKYTVDNFSVESNATLTIGKDVTITVENAFVNWGIINVCGTLNSNCKFAYNAGTVDVKCIGKTNGRISDSGKVVYNNHVFVDGICTLCGVKGCETGELEHAWKEGVCSVCNKSCSHEWDSNTGKCTICEYQCPHDGNTCIVCGQDFHSHENTFVGSVLSQGNLTVIVGIVASVVFGLGGFMLGRKKSFLSKDAED